MHVWREIDFIVRNLLSFTEVQIVFFEVLPRKSVRGNEPWHGWFSFVSNFLVLKILPPPNTIIVLVRCKCLVNVNGKNFDETPKIYSENKFFRKYSLFQSGLSISGNSMQTSSSWRVKKFCESNNHSIRNQTFPTPHLETLSSNHYQKLATLIGIYYN